MGAATVVQLTDDVRAALDGGHLTHLTTLNPDGSPQVTVVWIGLDGDEIVCGHLPEHQKVRNMRRDPRVVLSLVTGGTGLAASPNTSWSPVELGSPWAAEGPSSCSTSPAATSGLTSSFRRWTSPRPASSPTSRSTGSAASDPGRPDPTDDLFVSGRNLESTDREPIPARQVRSGEQRPRAPRRS